MTEWWSYSLSDLLLFSLHTYHRLFELYNRDLWPLPILALALGAAIPLLTLGTARWRGRAIALVLAAAWLWVAWGWHLQRYAAVNPAATGFAVAFALQALLLSWLGGVRDRLAPHPGPGSWRHAGVGLMLFSLLLPLAGLAAGRPWSQAEVFGLAPDPTAVMTLGAVLIAAPRVHWSLLVLPLACLVGSAAVLHTLGSAEAVWPLVAVVLAAGLAAWRTLGS